MVCTTPPPFLLAQGYSNSWMTSLSWVDVPGASPAYQWYSAVYWMITAVSVHQWFSFLVSRLVQCSRARVPMAFCCLLDDHPGECRAPPLN